MTEPTPIEQQPEDVPGRPILWTIGAIILAIGACMFVVWLRMSFRLGGGGETLTHHMNLLPPAQPFARESGIERVRAAQLRELDTWTWADRTRRIVSEPIDVAIDRYLEQRGAR